VDPTDGIPEASQGRNAVIQLTRLNGPVFALNPDLIERADATPDTVVTLVNVSKYVVRETLDELIQLILAYKSSLVAASQQRGDRPFSDSAPFGRHDAGRAGSGQATVVALRPEEP
jgi:flagellar protein FlbD